MSYEVHVTETAERDLAGISDYLTAGLHSPSAALKVLDEFEQVVGVLEQTPGAFPRVRDEMLAAAGYRWAPVSAYAAFYTVDEDERRVTVERVLHGSRNWSALI